MKLAIERNLSSPKSILRARRLMIERLEVGENCKCEAVDIKTAIRSVGVVRAAHPKRRFECSTEQGGVRVWRVD